MDFINNVITQNLGALIVGGAWGLYTIAQSITKNLRDNKRQDTVDSASERLLSTLQKSISDANKLAADERDRADRLATSFNDLSTEMGTLRANLVHADEDRKELRAEVGRLTETIEQLVIENRNKDKSITQLVDLNRQILKSIGSTTDALEPASPSEKAP